MKNVLPEFQEKVKYLLKRDLADRSKAACYTYIAVGFVVAFTAYGSEKYRYIIQLAGFIGAISSIWRLLLSRKMISKPELVESPVFKKHLIMIYINATCWSVISSFITLGNNFSSTAYIITSVCSFAILMGGISSLSPHPMVQFYFTITNSLNYPLVMLYRIYTENIEDYKIMPYVFPLAFVYVFTQSKRFYANIVERHQADLMLKKERDHLQSVIDAVPGFLIFLDDKLTITSITKDLDKKFDNALRAGDTMDTDKFEFTRLVRKFKESKKLSASTEICINTKTGKEWFLISFSTVESTQSIVIVGTTIDEIRKAREQMTDQTNKAMNASKLAALGELAAGAGHEINNPVAIVYGYMTEMKLALQKVDFSLKEKFLEKIDKSSKNLMRIKKIVGGMRLLSRDAANDPLEPVVFKSILEDTLSLCQERFVQHGIDFKISEAPELELKCRATQVSQVLLNVLNNAYDAVEKINGKKIEVKFEKTQERFKVIIADNGPGVATENIERIYDPFFTTKEPGKGTGLGLAISKRIMAEHSGSIIYNYKNGAEFTLDFPLGEAVLKAS